MREGVLKNLFSPRFAWTWQHPKPAMLLQSKTKSRPLSLQFNSKREFTLHFESQWSILERLMSRWLIDHPSPITIHSKHRSLLFQSLCDSVCFCLYDLLLVCVAREDEGSVYFF